MDLHQIITKNNNNYIQEQQLDRVKTVVNDLHKVLDETARIRLTEIEKEQQSVKSNEELIEFTLTVECAIQNIINAFKKRVNQYTN